MKRFYFSESALAKELGTTRYQIAHSTQRPSHRAGTTKVFSLDESEVERLRRSFTNNADQVITEFDRADDAGRDHLAQDPAKYDVLRNHLHPRLRAEYARQQAASISA